MSYIIEKHDCEGFRGYVMSVHGVGLVLTRQIESAMLFPTKAAAKKYMGHLLGNRDVINKINVYGNRITSDNHFSL